MHGIIANTCEIIWQQLQSTYLKPPTTQKWKQIEQQFWNRWNFPNCCGALDGKHVVIQAPANSGSLFFNYKGTFSLVLMALVDANYKFIFVDTGEYGSNSDGSTFKNSNFGQSFLNGELSIPPPKMLPNFPEGGPVPHCIVADEAFPQRIDLMRPFPRGQRFRLPREEQIYNYRLSRVRRIVEMHLASWLKDSDFSNAE